ncbi:hypothetical protein EJ08DRAFT_572270, partial [Tothia fuscella]
RTSSTAAAADSLRPRNRRLISGLSDNGGGTYDNAPSNRIASPRRSPSHSRPDSPSLQVPSKYPSRTSVREIPRSQPFGHTSLGNGSRQSSSGALSGLWGNSWKTLTSTVLGSDSNSQSTLSSMKRRERLETSPRRNAKQSPSQWGPAGSDPGQIGAGTKEERETLVRAAKRKDLLRANGNAFPDSNGNFKRRNSDEFSASSVRPSAQDDRDALVYLHHVRPQDTLMGITIRFNCQPAVLRKANRMWPNDPIQSRKTIVLPVDACGVKGRPVLDPTPINEEEDLLGDDSMNMHESPNASTPTLSNGWGKHDLAYIEPPKPPSEQRPPSSATSTNADAEPPWKHDSWVLLPNEKEPVEIARLPRRDLGFFPRARRKSNTFSDIGTPRLTPTTSIDLPRIPSSPGSAQSEAYAALRPSLSRNRSSSNAAFPATSLFHGPGGVGTLGKNVRIPGPGTDRLNELLGPHLPSVAPPPNQTVFTPWNPGLSYDDDLISFGSGVEGTSASSTPGPGMDFQQFGGSIERWMRKTAKRAATALETSSAAAASKGNAGVMGMGAGSGVADLIELTDAFEIGNEDVERVGNGLDVSTGLTGSSGAALSG